jgi:cyclophilin family peptidyl-prolyl cis-trans isomerase
MKKTLMISFLALGLGIGIYSITGASFIGFKNSLTLGAEKKVCITTSYGDIKVKLYDKTVQHCDNFIKLVKASYFDGTLFHRVIQNFMIQGGDPDSRNADSTAILGNGGPAYTIPAEFLFDTVSLKTDAGIKKTKVPVYIHKKGALAAAREGDNVNPLKASSGSQFYIVQGQVFDDNYLNYFELDHQIMELLSKPEYAAAKAKYLNYYYSGMKAPLDSMKQVYGAILDKMPISTPKFTYSAEQRTIYKTIGGTPHLDGDYTVFGEVYEGLDVVDKIAAVKTGAYARPLKDVKMISVKVIE